MFVEFIPRDIDDGILYISQQYQTAVHKCCCGCGQKVVTPLSTAGWRLTIRASRVTLYPSIGNWSFPCRSHYWIRGNRVVWSYKMTEAEIKAGRELDARARDEYVVPGMAGSKGQKDQSRQEQPARGFWARLEKWLFG